MSEASNPSHHSRGAPYPSGEKMHKPRTGEPDSPRRTVDGRNPIRTTLKPAKPLFVGIRREIISPGSLRLCRIWSIHNRTIVLSSSFVV